MQRLCLLFLLMFAAPAAGQQVLARRSLSRTVDSVVIEGSTLGQKILGHHKSKIRVYACRGGFMIPITYQIDEKNGDGLWCFDRGLREHRRVDRDRGRIDGNDELVVLAREAGDRAKPEAFAMIPGHSAVQEVELTDPLNEQKAWIYVVRFDGPPPGRTSTDLVSLEIKRLGDEEGHYTWSGDGFMFNNGRSPLNAARATTAVFRQAEGMSESMLDCTVVKAVVSFMWVTVERHSDEFKVAVGGYIDGPIRVIAQNLLQIYLALGIWVEAPESYLVLWPNRVTMPTNVSCPVNLDESDESHYSLCWDFSRRARGWKFYNSHNSTPVDIDGRFSDAERNLDLTFPDWNASFGPEGAMISKFVIPREVRGPRNRLIYVDDLNHKLGEPGDKQEFEPGAVGLNGYFMDMQGLKEGMYSGDYAVWYLPPPFKQGDEVPYLREYDHPIVARRGSFSK